MGPATGQPNSGRVSPLLRSAEARAMRRAPELGLPQRRRRLLDTFVVRRTVEDKTFEQVGGAWRTVASTPAGTDDTPAPRTDHPECLRPPDLHSYDSPGWLLNVRKLSTGAGTTSAGATRVELRMNFEEWIAASSLSIRVASAEVQWSSVIKLRWAGTAWQQEPASAIALVHLKL